VCHGLWCAPRLNPQQPRSAVAPFNLARISSEPDLLTFTLAIQRLAEQFGLDAAKAELFATTGSKAARLLFATAGTAETVMSAGPSGELQLIISVDRAQATDLTATLAGRIEELRGQVKRLSVAQTARSFSLVLAVSLPMAALALPPQLTTTNVAAPTEAGAAALAEENAKLRRSLLQLQSEMQETNRGVVALYAEVHDQTERLRQEEERMRVLLDSVQDYAICMLAPDGEIVSWNSGAARVFGYASDEIVGRNASCFYLASERDAGLPAEHLRIAAATGRLECEALRVRRGGGAFDALVLITVMHRPDGKPRGFSMVVRDITERRRLETDLRRRADDLAAANRAKEEFLATLSHELRTPLNAMLGWTRLLRTGKLDAAGMTRALDTIERNAHVQEQLIADILDVSRIVTGKLRVELRPIELEPVMEAALDALRPAAEAKGVHLTSEIVHSGTVMSDPDRLQQVIWNLLANAIKFTPASGRVHLSLDRKGPHAEIRVTDTGEGIAPALLPYVFDRFTQGDASVTRPHGGLGLGLSIVRHIVELHGGQVHASSEGPGKGASFSVMLPIRAVRVASQSRALDDHPLSGLRVLVVDDDADAREVVSLALADCGARTRGAGSAREALQLLPDFRPDVLVSDISMPGEDGYDLIRRIRALAARGLGDVPAVALTGLSDADERGRALMAGFQQFIPKPVEVDQLARVVRSLAHQRR
jgi:PAS domain S-box-containing protein